MKKTAFFLMVLLSICATVEIDAQSRAYPFDWDNATVYFMLNDRFNNGDTGNDYSYGRQRNSQNGELDFQGGDLKGITQKINEGYFDDLGVNAIWITAPYEQMHGSVGGENAWAFHGYWTKDWSQIDDNMGTEQDLRDMVDAAHDHGIRVIMDIVLNHSGYPTSVDAGWPGDWARYNNDCNWGPGEDPRYCNLAGLPDFYTEHTSGNYNLPQWLLDKWDAEGVKVKELAELDAFFARTGYARTPRYYLMKWLIDWVREFGIDGFRIDTAKHVEVEAWKELKDLAVEALRLWKTENPAKKPDDLDFWMTGEVFDQTIDWGKNYYFDHGFDNIINFGFKNEVWNDKEQVFSKYANAINNDPGFNVLSYVASHDVAPASRSLSNMYHYGTMLMLCPGGIQIYYGDESNRPFFNPQTYSDAGYRQFMNWDAIANDQNVKNLLAHWQKLGRFRREHLSVGGGSHQKHNDSPYIFSRSFSKNGIQDNVVVALDVPENSSHYTLNVYGKFNDGTVVKDYFSGDVSTVSGGQVTFDTPYGMILAGIPFEESDRVDVDIQPISGHYDNAIPVSMSASTTAQGASVDIYYTEDGSDPDLGDARYTSSFNVGGTQTESVTIKARAYDSEGNYSSVETRNYTFGEKVGYDIHFKNTNNWSQVYVYLFDKNANTALPGWTWPGVPMEREATTSWYKYTVDEDVEVGIVFNNNNNGQQTDDLFRTTVGWFDFSNTTWYDNCPGDCPNVIEVPELTVNPTSTSFETTIDVNLSATNSGKIYYTTNGTAPDDGDTEYTGTLTFNSTTNLRAIAYNDGGNSNTINETYTKNVIGVPVLTVDPVGGEYNNAVTVSLSATNGGEIYYTTNNTLPSESSTPYTGSLTFDATTTLRALAFNSAGQSNEVNETYTIIPTEGFVVHFKNTNNWNDVYIYLYDKNANAALPGWSWPGKPMSQESGSQWYAYTINEDVEVGIVFNNNNNGSQTADLTRTTDGWYDNSNSAWYNSCPSDCPGEQPEGLTIYYKNNNNWNDVKLYFWNVTPTGQSTGWPGVSMTDADGDGWYTYTFEGAECANVIFSNNGGNQTQDLYICDVGYYDNGWVSAPAGVKNTESITSIALEEYQLSSPYPNPFSDRIMLDITSESNVSVNITDINGREVFGQSYSGDEGVLMVEPEIPHGIYIMHVTTSNKSATYRIIKQ